MDTTSLLHEWKLWGPGNESWDLIIPMFILSMAFLTVLKFRGPISRLRLSTAKVGQLSGSTTPSNPSSPDDAPQIISSLQDLIIEPLKDFDWRETEVIKQRPFKPVWHMTMAVEKTLPSELIQIDKLYLDRINTRKRIMAAHRETVLVANAAIQPAINELYAWLMGSYLPQRFPTIFKIFESENNPAKYLHNTITGATHPLIPPSAGPDSVEALRILGETVEEDFMFLLPAEDGDSFVLEGAVACFPSSWSPKEKHGMKMREIHAPVPKFKEKLEISLDRFLRKLEPGKYVRRANWAITMTNDLFAAVGDFHAYENSVEQIEVLDPQVAVMRSERQTVHKLPQSRAVVFSFKSFLYPLCDIKDEGNGESLAQAIDGLLRGSVPEIHHYKRGDEWAEPVKAYLRSESARL